MTAITTRAQAGQARPRHRTSTLLWAAQIALAVVFLVSAVPKLAGAHSAVTMFTRIGPASGCATWSAQPNWPGPSACSSPSWPGWPPPGSPPT